MYGPCVSVYHFYYDTAGRSVLDVSGAVVGPLTRVGAEKGH